MYKVAVDMSKGFDAILDTAEELVAMVRDRQQTPDAAVTALAMALGKIAAENDLSLEMVQDLVRISYVEAGKRSGGQA